MNRTKDDLIKYRFNRALECLEEAKILAAKGHWNTVANRLYYASFYAINSLFVKYDIRAITHSGVKSSFHKEFIKTGIISFKNGLLYNDLFNKRQEGDYQDFQQFDQETIEPLIFQVSDFIKDIEELIF